MIVRTKICGITDEEALAAAGEHGAAAVGFVFAESPRRISIARAIELTRGLPAFIMRVAVFRHPPLDDVRRVCEAFGPDLVQCEPAPDLEAWLDGRVRLLPVLHDHADLLDEASHPRCARGVLLEAPGRGGRGVAPDHDRARTLARIIPLILAGGLSPDNVADAIRRVRPCGVDVSSGVEREPGIKDPDLVAAFLRAVRAGSTPIPAPREAS